MDTNFDPDAYLASKEAPQAGAGGEFNPDAYLASKESPLEAAGRGLVNNLPFGGQIGAFGTKVMSDQPQDMSSAFKEWKTKAEAAKEAQPEAYGIGAVTGAVAPALIPGAGAASKAAPFLTNAAMGAGYALGDTDLAKAPASEIAKRGTMGAILGGTIGKATEGAGWLASKAIPEQVKNRVEAGVISNFLKLNPRSAAKLTPGITNPETAMIGVGKRVEELFPKAFGLNDTSATVYQKILNGHELAQKTLGDTVDTISRSGIEMPEVNQAIREFRTLAKQRFGKLTSADNVQAKAFLNDQATILEDLQRSGNLTFRDLANLKSSIGEEFHNFEASNKGADAAYAIMSKKIDAITQRASEMIDPALKPAYDHARKVFAFTSNLLPAMKRGITREVVSQGGKLANMGLAATAMLGHPLAAAGAYAGKTAAHMAAPELGTNLAYRAMTQGIPQVPQAMDQALTDYLLSEYGPKSQ